MRHTSSRQRARRNGAAVLASAAAALSAVLACAPAAHAELIFGLGSTATNQNLLFSFDSATPNTINGTLLGITGIGATENVVGIDFRPRAGAEGGLFALARDTSSNALRLYTLNTATGAASGGITLSVSASADATTFGVDFNPVPGALRIVTNGSSNNNLRVTGVTTNGATTADTNLSADASLSGAFGIVGAAYISNDDDAATGTALFNLDAVGNRIVRQGSNPANGAAGDPGNPNSGVLFGLANATVGFDFTEAAGFDVSGLTGSAYASLLTQGEDTSRFYTANLVEGSVAGGSFIGGAGSGIVVRGIAAPVSIGAAVPEPGTMALVGLMALPAAGALAARRRRTKAA